MFPLRDDNPTFRTPYATIGLIAANIAAWVLVQGLGSEQPLANSICNLGLVPADLMQSLPAGTRFPVGPDAACVLTGQPAWHTLITSMFLHGGWLHLIGNMWFLWIFGNNVEDAMGRVRFVVFYLLCGLAAAGAQIAANPDSAAPMVGASGAIGGVMGAYVLLYPHVHVHLLIVLGFYVTTIAVPAWVMLGYWFLLQFLSGWGSVGGAGGGVAFWAHVGGFAAGAVLVMPFRNRRLLDEHPFHGWSGAQAPTQNWRRVRR